MVPNRNLFKPTHAMHSRKGDMGGRLWILARINGSIHGKLGQLNFQFKDVVCGGGALGH